MVVTMAVAVAVVVQAGQVLQVMAVSGVLELFGVQDVVTLIMQHKEYYGIY